MAREQRRDVDYFPHECTHGRKMHIIEAKYGNDGYATWFKILEQLGKANNHYLDLSDESDMMFMTSICRIDEDKLLAIINDLSKLCAIDKYLWENHQVIWSQKFVDSVVDAYRNRKNKVPEYEDLIAKYESDKNSIRVGNPSIFVRNPSIRVGNPSIRGRKAEVIRKEENSRVKKRKEEKSKGDNTPNGVVGLQNQPPAPKIDFDKLILFFNQNRGMMPEVKKLSEPRKKRIAALTKQYGKEAIQEVIQKARDSQFLQGINKENWTASFDWIFKPANFIKILENNYENRELTTTIDPQAADHLHKQSAVEAVAAMFGR